MNEGDDFDDDVNVIEIKSKKSVSSDLSGPQGSGSRLGALPSIDSSRSQEGIKPLEVFKINSMSSGSNLFRGNLNKPSALPSIGSK